MPNLSIIIENSDDWKPFYPSERIMLADDYLHSDPSSGGNTQIINLCREYDYLSKGYYCSLLAEARGDKVIPTVTALTDINHKPYTTLSSKALAKALVDPLSEENVHDQFQARIFFGVTRYESLKDLARQLFELFPCPILSVKFKNKHGEWRLEAVTPSAINTLSDSEEDDFASVLDRFSQKVWRKSRSKRRYRYEMALLHNPAEKMPPSNRQALNQFVKAAKRLDIDMELITKKDFFRLNEFDGLFIRETTSVNHHTYKFARKAESAGLVVIDDSESILKCTNKVYLWNLLHSNYVPAPHSLMISKDDPSCLERVAESIGFPVVLKIPDGSFSRGVVKANNPPELAEKTKPLFAQSTLLVAQEFMYTDFDWRIGVLSKKPLFACQYFMSKGHWQIYDNNTKTGSIRSGKSNAMPVEKAPAEAVRLALKAANLIGDGFYGVDIKQRGDNFVVIEVNDNPSVDSGVEDQHSGPDLYRQVIEYFLMKLERKRIGLR